MQWVVTSQTQFYNAIGKVCGAQRTCPAVSQSVTAILLPLTVIEPEAREKKYY